MSKWAHIDGEVRCVQKISAEQIKALNDNLKWIDVGDKKYYPFYKESHWTLNHGFNGSEGGVTVKFVDDLIYVQGDLRDVDKENEHVESKNEIVDVLASYREDWWLFLKKIESLVKTATLTVTTNYSLCDAEEILFISVNERKNWREQRIYTEVLI